MSAEKDLRKQKKVVADISADTSALAKETTLGSIKTQTDKLTFTAGKLNVDASVTIDTSLLATKAKQDLLLSELQLKADLTETQPVGIVGTPNVNTGHSQPLTDAQLRLTPVPVSITGFATEATLGTRLSESDFDIKTGSLTETAPATDTASSGLNGRLQRIAQRLSSLITALGSPFQAGGLIGNTSFIATQATASNLNAQTAQIAAIIPTATTMQNAAVATGNGTNLNVLGYVSAIVSITGSMGMNSRIEFEASVDDITFIAIAGHQVGVAGSLAIFTTNTNDFRFNAAGYKSLRARISTYGTGTITVRGYASAVAGHSTTVNANIIGFPAEGLISTVNSTAVNLAANAVFTGTSEDLTIYSNIKVSIFSSHVSATDGLSIQQSIDGTNWDANDLYTIPSNNYKTFSVAVNSKFFRIVYTNGATLTTSLRIQVIYSKFDKQPSSVRPQDARSNDNDFVEMLGFAMGYNGTSWDRLRSSIANGLQVDVTKKALTANAATSVTCNATTTVLIATNASRKGLVITNTGTRAIFIGIGASAVLNQGIYLTPNGGCWCMDEYSFTTQAINGIATSATSNVSIQEFQ